MIYGMQMSVPDHYLFLVMFRICVKAIGWRAYQERQAGHQAYHRPCRFDIRTHVFAQPGAGPGAVCGDIAGAAAVPHHQAVLV